MRILGIDPGSLKTGFGVIEVDRGVFKLIDCGYIANSSKTPLPLRFSKIFEGLKVVIVRSSPNEAAVETLFYFKNPRTAFKLGEARGVAILALAQHQLPVYEYEPRRVKQAVVGFGSAHKSQVSKMVLSLLRLKDFKGPEDITDALAVAICHAHHLKAMTKHQASNSKQ
ncbi:MAG: crossover junction endodeoxyribonuclease RuvC [Chlamydiae bacterium]|nr:crossover junction endodeoxyribonuclease RuvC [Chlamydiota bacterium]MBI3277646.1 crossover junction endodeoxyribonuclease RuvC [Chlamydiota bacterium]